MFFEPSGEVGFGEFAGRERHHHRVGFLLVGDYLPAVLLQDDIHENKGDSLVAVNKWMVLADVTSIGRSFVEESPVDKLSPSSHLWLGKGRVEEAGISQSGASTISLQQVRMNRGDDSIRDEASSHYFPRA